MFLELFSSSSRIILAMQILDVPLVRIQFPINGDISATISTLFFFIYFY